VDAAAGRHPDQRRTGLRPVGPVRRGKVVYIGGGIPPTANAETIDLSQPQPKWQATGRMHFPRRQHNATILPDGTVLVTGGTRGDGVPGTAQAFNDLAPGQPVHVAELWDPATGRWTELAAEAADRCYHSTAVLLPDATVLSAGGGEFFAVDGQTQQNDPQDSHRDAQVFSPPYLFKGPRPEITSAPSTVRHGETFDVGTPQAAKVRKVSWVGLSSVTHAFNMTQRINFLRFEARTGSIKVTAPATANVSPPGYYMLFILSDNGVPSVARIVRIGLPALRRDATAVPQPDVVTLGAEATAPEAPLDAFAQHDRIQEAARGTRVVVGVQSTCPYGLDACWGAANEALGSLEGVEYVDPIPDGASSTATVYLEGTELPALDRWGEQFRRMVNESYLLRGVEVTLEGPVEGHDGTLVLQLDGSGRSVELAPLEGTEKIQWDRPRRQPQPVEREEAAAYDALAALALTTSPLRVTVTGPLHQTEMGYRLHVRLVER
jgi:galactose oxidase